MFIPYLSLVYTIPAGHCADCPRYHFVLEDPSDVPLGECWVTLPQLFLTCHLRSTDSQKPVTLMPSTTSESCWYSTAPSKNWTCPVLVLWESGCAELAAELLLAHTNAHPPRGPSLRCAGSRALDSKLIPLFLHSNCTPAIPYALHKHQRSRLQYGRVYAVQVSGRRRSNV